MVNTTVSRLLSIIAAVFSFSTVSIPSFAQLPNTLKQIENKDFNLQFSSQGISGLRKTKDVYPTDYVQQGKPFLGLVIRYQLKTQDWDSLKTSVTQRKFSAQINSQHVKYTTQSAHSAIPKFLVRRTGD